MYLTVKDKNWTKRRGRFVLLTTAKPPKVTDYMMKTCEGYSGEQMSFSDFAVKTPMAEKRKKEEALYIESESCPVEESPCQLNWLEGGAQRLDQPRHSQRDRRPPVRYGFDEVADMTGVDHVAYRVCQIKEPNTIEETFASEHGKQWKAATDSEFKALMDSRTWELNDLPEGREAIGCKWVSHIKHTSDGKAERFKGRLVAKGYSQKCGINYNETFSPVVRFQSL